MNKQPFYHQVVVLFTTTEPITDNDEFEAAVVPALQKALRPFQVIPSSVEIEERESEAGDPADLL